jgi:outer membrane murein-binding lipoprotein Lpp
MRKGLVALLKGKFLVSGDAPRNWLFIVFASVLATIMIASSHSADRKVHEIAALNEQVTELRSEFVEMRSKAQRLKLESTIREAVAEAGLLPAETPPRKIIVEKLVE